MNIMGALAKRMRPAMNAMEQGPEKKPVEEATDAGTIGSPLLSRWQPLGDTPYELGTPSRRKDGLSDGRIWLYRAWAAHFMVAIFVLTVGMLANHESR